jgi:hypothetical protein
MTTGLISGNKSYLTLADESVWGTTPGSPVYYHWPVTSYGVMLKNDRRNTASFAGVRQRRHGHNYRGMPAGSIAGALYGWKPGGSALSLAQYLIQWGMEDYENITLPSKLAEWAEGPNISNVVHNGLRVNTCTIEGTQGGMITITLDVMGKTETALITAQALPDDREGCIEMDFEDCTFSLAGSAVTPLSFKWTVVNTLQAVYEGSRSPTVIAAGIRTETLSMGFLKKDDVYEAANRATGTDYELAGGLVLKGNHHGTGTVATNYTVGTISFPRLQLINPDQTRNLSTLYEHTLNFDVLKPDASTNGSAVAWSEV